MAPPLVFSAPTRFQYFGQFPDGRSNNPDLKNGLAGVGIFFSFVIPPLGFIISFFAMLKGNRINNGFGKAVLGMVISLIMCFSTSYLLDSGRLQSTHIELGSVSAPQTSSDIPAVIAPSEVETVPSESSIVNDDLIIKEEVPPTATGQTVMAENGISLAMAGIDEDTWKPIDDSSGMYYNSDQSAMLYFQFIIDNEASKRYTLISDWNIYVDRLSAEFGALCTEIDRTVPKQDQYGYTYAKVSYVRDEAHNFAPLNVVVKTLPGYTIQVTSVVLKDNGQTDFDAIQESLMSIH